MDMAALEKEKLIEKLKGLTPEERSIFREAVYECDPESSLSTEEISTLRELLKKGKGKKKGILDAIDSLFD
jgi:hypothetical protein